MSYDVPSQEMLTKDSVTVSVDAAVYYRTSDPIASAIFITDPHLSTKQLAQSSKEHLRFQCQPSFSSSKRLRDKNSDGDNV